MHAKNIGFLSSISFLAWWGCAVAQTYTVVDLGLGQAWSINDEGQVVGNGYCNPHNEFAAQIWSGGTCSPLGPANLGYPAALAINNAGLVVGSAFSSGTTDAILFVGASLDLGGAPHGVARDINESGVVVGDSVPVNYAVATLWPAGCVSISCATLLSALGQSEPPNFYAPGSANAVNARGQVVGVSNFASGGGAATLWNSATAAPTDLGSLTGCPNTASSTALGINNQGVIIGYSCLGGTVWKGLKATRLPPVTGTASSTPYGINNAGVIVGSSAAPGQASVATLWRGTVAVDLNAVSVHDPNVTLQWATAINSRGQIVVNSYDSVANTEHVYLLTPIGKPGP